MIERERTSLDERQMEALQGLPPGFRYPDRFVEILSQEPLVDIEPWMWLFYYRDQFRAWQGILREQFPTRTSVPFAKHGDTDDVFCFDGDSRDGAPAVLQIHTFTTPGWEYRGQWASFDDWWAEMEAQHADWLAEQEAEED